MHNHYGYAGVYSTPASIAKAAEQERILSAIIDGLVSYADHRPTRSRSAALLRDAAATLHDAANALKAEALS